MLAIQLARAGAAANAADNTRQTASKPADGEVRKPTENRIALLVCCGAYPNGKNIWPARKNGRDLEAALRVHGFDVQVAYDADRPGFTAAVDRFKRQIHALPDDGRTIGIVYFVGHGMQYEGHNYLLPSGVSIDDPSAKEKSISLQDEVLAAFPQHYPGLGVAIIDACRDGISP
ncbi:MAG: caspase family protein, partial [Candidatus Accumulibacter sp.]|nr:caspase family protein [Accumulibacter sp.]